MVDIAMCSNHASCPATKRCKRSPDSGSTPGMWQAWMGFDRDPDDLSCRSFYPIDGKAPPLPPARIT